MNISLESQPKKSVIFQKHWNKNCLQPSRIEKWNKQIIIAKYERGGKKFSNKSKMNNISNALNRVFPTITSKFN